MAFGLVKLLEAGHGSQQVPRQGAVMGEAALDQPGMPSPTKPATVSRSRALRIERALAKWGCVRRANVGGSVIARSAYATNA